MLPSSQSSQNTLSTDIDSTQFGSLLPLNPLTDPLQQGNELIGSSAANPLSISPGVGVTITDFIGNTLQAAYNIGDLNDSRFNYTDSVSSADTNDFYRFHLDNAATVNFGLSSMSADADLYLLDGIGNTIDFSIQLGNSNEAISRFLSAGVYYAQVKSFIGATTSYSLSVNGGGIARDPGSDRSSARDLGNLSRKAWNINDFVGTSDLNDYYRFDLSENGNFHLSLSDLSSDVDVVLYNRVGNSITSSTQAGILPEGIDRFLNAGTYYLRVYPHSGSSNYTLGVRTDTPSYSGTRTLTGTLRADTFDVTGNYTRTVISGDGNVDFGTGRRDVLDLSGLLSTSVSINYANTTGAGVLYDPGNGTRVFDSILLNDGRQILFEGIDQIQFSDRTINLAIVPNDPLFSQQWNLSMMGVQDAWRFTTGSGNVLIGIEDSGLGINNFGNIHPDLRIPIIVDNNLADEFDEPTSHGTSVEGILSAITNNGIGLSGVNWNSPVAQVDVIPGSEVGDRNLTQATQELITQAARSGQRLVINLSLSANTIEPAFEQLIASHQTDVLFVIASGNDGISSLSYPAYLAYFYSNVIAVGASFGTVDSNGNAVVPGTRAPYSDYGYGLTLMGPTNVIATGAVALPSGTVFGYDPQFTGTSAAAPNVTGVASLVWSANPNLTAIQVQQVLSETAYDLGAPGYDFVYGHGFVNADTAVRRAIALAEGLA